MWLRSGDCAGRLTMDTFLIWNHFFTSLDACLGSLSWWNTHPRPILWRANGSITSSKIVLYMCLSIIPSTQWMGPTPDQEKPISHLYAPTLMLNSWKLVLGIQVSAFRTSHIHYVIRNKHIKLQFATPEDFSPFLRLLRFVIFGEIESAGFVLF